VFPIPGTGGVADEIAARSDLVRSIRSETREISSRPMARRIVLDVFRSLPPPSRDPRTLEA
jgi:hypothetical protein